MILSPATLASARKSARDALGPASFSRLARAKVDDAFGSHDSFTVTGASFVGRLSQLESSVEEGIEGATEVKGHMLTTEYDLGLSEGDRVTDGSRYFLVIGRMKSTGLAPIVSHWHLTEVPA